MSIRTKIEQGAARPWGYPWTLALLGVAALVLALHEARYGNFFTDDGFISLRYTRRLLQGQGLTWDDYERVEGYSNLLWVLICAIPGAVGIDLVQGARGIGFLATIASFAAIVHIVRPKTVRDGLAAFAAVAFLLASGSIAVWSTGGLEPPLLLALLLWALAVLGDDRLAEKRRERWAALLVGLACWTRPDAPLFGVLLAVAVLAQRRREGLRTALHLLGGVGLFVAAQLTFRWFYYDDLLPNTAYAKVVINENRLKAGIDYLSDSLWPLAATWCVLLLGLAHATFESSRRRQLIPPLLMALGWVGYLVRVGGDNFPAWRHMPYVIGLAAVVLAILIAEERKQVGRTLGLAYFSVSIVLLAWVGTFFDPKNWAVHERWQWDGRPVAKVLATAFAAEQPRVAVDAAGAIPLFSGLPAVDMLGLNDRYLAHHRPEGMGKNLIGHELGDADYYLKRKPDLFCFGVPPCFHGPRFVAQHDMVRKREFREDYIPVRIQTRLGKKPLISEFWLDKTGRLGPKFEQGKVTVPGHLFEGRPPLSRLEGDQLVSAFEHGRAFTRLQLEAGRYRLDVIDAHGRAKVSVDGGGVDVSGELGSPLDFELGRPDSVEIALTPSEGPVELRKVVLTKR